MAPRSASLNDDRCERLCTLSRRRWLAGAVAALPVFGHPDWLWAAQDKQAASAASEKDEIAQVDALAKKAGLAPFAHSRKEHFLGLGDAPQSFCDAALGISESLSVAFLAYFRERGFTLALPKRPMTVITLKDDASYRAFIGDDPGANVGGHYDLDSNRLVVFDNRPRREEFNANPERINLITLVHETSHMLAYNTGLLSRTAQVPDWVSEGLAIYVELWQRKPKTPIGTVHRPWLMSLHQAKKPGATWIPVADLVAGDDRIWDPKTQELAYAESWLLVHYLMKEQLPKFRAYLAAVNKAPQGTKRVDLFEKHFGPVKTVGEHVDRYLKRISR